MSRYWMSVASREHVQRGVQGSFAQVCHGKSGPLRSMNAGDWIVYYSPTITYGGKDLCRSFTAIGKVHAEDPYPFVVTNDFIPWRRNVTFLKCIETPILPLLDRLAFIKDKKKWGFPFRRGCFEITEEDFQLIAKMMGI